MLALLAILWLKVAGATYSKISNCNSGFYKIFYNCLSTLGPVGPVDPIKPTESSGTTENYATKL